MITTRPWRIARSLASRQPWSDRLLARLAEQEPKFDFDAFEVVDCPLKMLLAAPGQVTPHVYFLDEGAASVVARSPEGLRVEAGFIGWEGIVVPALALGVDSVPHLCQMQIAGHGRRMTVPKFRETLEASRTLRDLCLLFAQVALVQTACTALSNAVHQIDERLARWLLMSHDRSPSDDIAITHEFMSVMLGVRRPTATSSLHVLEGNGFIRSERGYVQMKDRPGLELFAGYSYGAPEDEYRRLIGPF